MYKEFLLVKLLPFEVDRTCLKKKNYCMYMLDTIK